MSDAIHAGNAPRAVGHYPHARRVGELLFLSGIGPRDPATNAIPGNEYFADSRVRRYDIEAQARAAFANVRAVREAGYDVLVWTVNEEEDMRRLVEWGVSGIFTDFTQRLDAVLGR